MLKFGRLYQNLVAVIQIGYLVTTVERQSTAACLEWKSYSANLPRSAKNLTAPLQNVTLKGEFKSTSSNLFDLMKVMLGRAI